VKGEPDKSRIANRDWIAQAIAKKKHAEQQEKEKKKEKREKKKSKKQRRIDSKNSIPSRLVITDNVGMGA